MKCTYNNETRVFELEDVSIDKLIEKVKTMFKIDDFLLKYHDQEDDLISLTTTSELKTAMMQGHRRISIYPKSIFSQKEMNLLDSISTPVRNCLL